MTEKEREYHRCERYFDALAELLKDKYVVVNSCNKDLSRYLVPKGKEGEITYYGKPENSFRISDHWNWYSPLTKCNKADEIQCWNIDIEEPIARDPKNPERGTPARQVCAVGWYKDGHYRTILGARWNPKEEKYDWYVTNKIDIVKKLL